MPVSMTCSYRSVGRGGRWPFLSRNWRPSIRTDQPRRRSATGITGLHRAVFSEAPTNSPHTEHIMARRQSASKPTWADVKAELATFDRPGLLALIQDLYAAHK